ncbi:MAG: hypothetical protein ACP5VE_06825 [Chthonomonadales bacterium]
MLGLLVMVALMDLGSRGEAPPALTASQPGGVFLDTQPVTLQVTGVANPAGLVVRLKPYGGDARPLSVSAAGGTLNLGVLPRGYYEVSASEGTRTATLPVVVVPHPRVPSQRIATDAALSWLIPQGTFDTGAELLARAGFGWVRERLSWSGVEQQRGVYHWDQYDASADAEHRRSIHIVQVFHDTPAWARADHARNRYPDDLRDVYLFAREAARHFKGRVDAWEVWNEADIDAFSADTGDAYAAFLKAAYLGFKAGDPHVQVAQVSFAGPAQEFARALYRNGTQGYFDVFNYHIYADPRAYATRARGHFALLDEYRVPACPVWVTEAGIALRAHNGALSPEDQRKQAEFIPKAYALSLAAGTDRHFFFVFPHYLENGIEFGAIGPDFRPYPGYAALAAAVDLLGRARYLGKLRLEPHPDGLHAYVFDNGAGLTLVAWTEPPAQPVHLPLPQGSRVYNCVGAEQPGADAQISSSPVYIVCRPGTRLAVEGSRLERTVRPNKPPYASSPIVLRVLLPPNAVNKAKERYELPLATSTHMQIELYNFGSHPIHGTIHLAPPAGWSVRPERLAASAKPMERAVLHASLTPPEHYRPGAAELRAEFVADGTFKHRPAAPVSLMIATQLSPAAVLHADSLPVLEPDKWTNNIAEIGHMTRQTDPQGGVAFDFVFDRSGDRWAYPTVDFDPPSDWTRAQGLEVDFSTSVDDPDTRVRVMLVEPGGATWFTRSGIPAATREQHWIVPFSDLEPLGIGPADANGRLDLDRVSALRVGCNTSRDRVTLRLHKIALVRFR